MDERKRSSRLKSGLFYGIGVITLTFFGYSTFIYLTIPAVTDIKKCFTTTMFEVKLCPGSANYVPYNQIPEHVRRSLILSEDSSFYSHDGLDWYEIQESFKRNWEEGKFARGGSTITQQLAKNLYLSQRKSIGRKIQEFFVAREIEKVLKKSEIIEKYFNVVEFGEGIYGIKAAAKYYFYKSPAELNLLEGVYLISLLPSPRKLGQSFSRKRLSDGNIWRMKTILRRMFRTNRMSEMHYEYCLNLIEQQTWPFPLYNEYDVIEDGTATELADELDNLDTDLPEESDEPEHSEAVEDSTSNENEDVGMSEAGERSPSDESDVSEELEQELAPLEEE